MTIANPIKRRWTSDEYYRMAELGLFADQRVELIEGEVLAMAPQGSQHFTAICLTHDVLRRIFAGDFVIRVQGPLAVSADSEPEPDLAVVPGRPRDYAGKKHPSTALLVIEISDSTLDYDRVDKASLYASAGIADYWIVNLIDRRLEVHRRPVADSEARFGFSYSNIRIYSAGDKVNPLAVTGEISASELLP
jgi:Uma2 family endonuclease